MKVRGHDFSYWGDKVWVYFPIDMPPDFYAFQFARWLYIEPASRLGDRVLEIGAQTGLACIYLKLRHPNLFVVASDVNRSVCRMAKLRVDRWNVDVPIVVADAFYLPFREDAFSAVYSEGLHEHFDEEDRVDLVEESARVAGFQIVDVPTDVDFKHGGGYGDERRLSSAQWSQFFKSINGIKILGEFQRGTRYGVVLERVG